MNTPAKTRKRIQGIVIRSSMEKTIVVSAERFVQHPRYRKYIRRSTVYKAHDPNNDARTGDRVVIEETRPLSKTKRWRLVEITQRAPEGQAGPSR